MATNEIVKIYEMALSTPGMTDTIKIEIKMHRKNVFLLAKAIDQVLSDKNLACTNSVLGTIIKKFQTDSKMLQMSYYKRRN